MGLIVSVLCFCAAVNCGKKGKKGKGKEKVTNFDEAEKINRITYCRKSLSSNMRNDVFGRKTSRFTKN